MDSHAGVQVPDLHLLSVNCCEDRGTVRGPPDRGDLALDRCEA